ncbi:Threonine_homoserine exporter RhtA [Nocardiopsis dassonvillei]|uniref:EamA family transporter n=1 Tax=Nocardiopsis dassonvillei TaxID=2014 RepID=UPI003F54780E
MARIPAPVLVLCSVVSVQFGQALGKGLFDQVGPGGVVALRLSLAAAVLLVAVRPPPPRGRGEACLVLGLGTAIAGMNLVYPALVYVPLGLAASLQLLGPITLALLSSKRLRDLGFAAVAGLGLWLFHRPGDAEYAWAGVLLASASGVSMAAYLLLSRRAGAGAATAAPLAWALVWAAALTVPVGVAESGAGLLAPTVLLGGLAVAVSASVLPYSLEFAALRRLPPRTVGVMQSLEPAAAGAAGALLLAEYPSPFQWLALACVGAASAGIVACGDSRTGRRPGADGPAVPRGGGGEHRPGGGPAHGV